MKKPPNPLISLLVSVLSIRSTSIVLSQSAQFHYYQPICPDCCEFGVLSAYNRSFIYQRCRSKFKACLMSKIVIRRMIRCNRSACRFRERKLEIESLASFNGHEHLASPAALRLFYQQLDLLLY